MTEFSTDYARRTLLISLVSVGMGFTVLFPVLAPLGREMGLSEFQITAVIGASAIVVFLCSPLWGRTSDAWGRRRVPAHRPVRLPGRHGAVQLRALRGPRRQYGADVRRLVIARTMHAARSCRRRCRLRTPTWQTHPRNRKTVPAHGSGGRSEQYRFDPRARGRGPRVHLLLTPLWVMAAMAFLNGLFVWRFLPEPPRANAPARPRACATTRRSCPSSLWA